MPERRHRPLVDVESPTDAAPTEPSGSNFDFDARTDDFSAVNAYVHCDRFFRLVDSMGFARSAYFGGHDVPDPGRPPRLINTRPASSCNAHCVGTSARRRHRPHDVRPRRLGDTSHPIGIADDFRVVLHDSADTGCSTTT